MIFDWIKNCEDIYETKHFPNEDGQEKKTMIFQHITLFKFLEEQKGMTKEEVKAFWLTTDSPILSEIPSDDYEEWVEVEFDKIWQMRLRSGLNFTDENRMVYNFPIYQEEVDYINSLDCDTWSKKALLLLLACGKHNKRGLLRYNYTTTAWIEKMIDPTKKVENKMLKIGMLNVKYKIFKFTNFGSSTNKIKMNFMKNKGTPIAIVYSPNFMKDFLDLVKPYTITCKKCGKQFEPSPKGQTELCSECYKKQRRINKTQTMRNLRIKK